jgi:hypothetical protein
VKLDIASRAWQEMSGAFIAASNARRNVAGAGWGPSSEAVSDL